MRRSRRGIDERQFDELVRRHAGAVTAYATALARDRWAAEEAVQETFLRAWRYRDGYDGRGSLEGWLLRICRNCLVDAARRARPTEELVDGPGLAVAEGGTTELHALLRQLPLAQREVLVLCGLLGYDYAGAAELLDVPVGTVRSRLSRGRAALAAQLTGTDGQQGVAGG